MPNVPVGHERAHHKARKKKNRKERNRIIAEKTRKLVIILYYICYISYAILYMLYYICYISGCSHSPRFAVGVHFFFSRAPTLAISRSFSSFEISSSSVYQVTRFPSSFHDVDSAMLLLLLLLLWGVVIRQSALYAYMIPLTDYGLSVTVRSYTIPGEAVASR